MFIMRYIKSDVEFKSGLTDVEIDSVINNVISFHRSSLELHGDIGSRSYSPTCGMVKFDGLFLQLDIDALDMGILIDWYQINHIGITNDGMYVMVCVDGDNVDNGEKHLIELEPSDFDQNNWNRDLCKAFDNR